MPVKTLTPEEHDRIVELKLARATTTTICREVGVASATVDKHWHKFLAETSDARQGRLEHLRSEAIARLEQVAVDARHGSIRARSQGQHQAAARYLSVEQQALLNIAKLIGCDMPILIQHSGLVETVAAEPETERGAERAKLVSVVEQLAARGAA